MKAYKSSYYKRNSDVVKSEAYDRRKKLKQWYLELKKTLSCLRCGFAHPAAIDFHHTDPSTKEFDVPVMVAQGHSKKNIEKEIAKCETLCANCHRIHHYDERLERAVGLEPT